MKTRWWLWLPIFALGLMQQAPGAAAPAGNVVDTGSAAPTLAEIETLIRRGETQRAQGRNRDAARDLQRALAAAQGRDAAVLEALAGTALGGVYLSSGDFDLADPLLTRSLEQAQRLDLPGLAAACANQLGNLRGSRGERDAALELFDFAQTNARQVGDVSLLVAAQINAARTNAPIDADPGGALRVLLAAYDLTPDIAATPERAARLLAIGYQAMRLEGLGGREREDSDRLSAAVLRQARGLALENGDTRTLSMADGYLAAWYERARRPSEAMRSLDQAIQAAQETDAKDLLLQWEWQRGRLFRDAGETAQAIAAYRRAVQHIAAVRTDVPVVYSHGRSSFRETLEPVFLGLADLLIRQSRQSPDPKIAQALLTEARDTVESVKAAELDDYFRDACAVVTRPTVEIEAIASNTAVLYPVILSDRLELLLSVGGKKYSVAVPVTADELAATTFAVVESLRPTTAWLAPFAADEAKRLHDWLIAPVVPHLENHEIATLVFVPDGVLRLMPLAGLWDGERYLLERYAVATAPGLSLVDPQPIPRQGMTTLLAGLSRPGPVVEKLADSFFDAAVRGSPSKARRNMPAPAVSTRTAAGAETAPRSERDHETVKEALTLPGVREEIAALSEQLPAKVLLDEGFLRARFEREVLAAPYRIVHIASHGVFRGTPEESFIMTFDDLLDMRSLEGLLARTTEADQPVELFTLSACETAAGDDRSPLGLSGAVLKSGARSALGSLWAVSDDVVKELIPEFYDQLSDPEVSKAQALRKAQLKLLQHPQFEHPSLWSPFILIGNWL